MPHGTSCRGDGVTAMRAPAPIFGWHEAVSQYGRRYGAIVEVRKGEWTPVCMHKTCTRRLIARDTRGEARDALRNHWGAQHARKAKAAA